MKVQDFNWDEGALLNLIYLHWDVNSNPDKYHEWENFCKEHTYSWVMDYIERIPERTKKFAILFSLHERSLKDSGCMWNEGGITDYESAIAAMSEIMSRTGYIHNDVRFCNVCGMPMCEGYMLDPYETCGGYYCSTRCYKSDITEEELDGLLNAGTLIYTEWEGSGDSDDVSLIC